MKKTLIFLLALSMLLLSFPMPTFAADFSESEPNNTIPEANAITLDKRVVGEIAVEGDEDYFKLVLTESGRLDVSFESYLECYSLAVLIGDGTCLWHSDCNYINPSVGVLKQVHNIYLEAGTHFLLVKGSRYWDYNSDYLGSYNFALSFKPSGANVPEPNNNIMEAPQINTGEKVYGVISENYDEDFFKLVLTESGNIEIPFQSFMHCYSLTVFSEDGRCLWYSDCNYINPSVGVLNNLHKFGLEAGTYFFRVTGSRYWDYDSEYPGFYSFTPNFTPSGANVPEPNNGIIGAPKINTGEKIYGLIGLDNDEDYYKLVLPKSGKLNISFQSFIECYSLTLFSENGTEVAYWDCNKLDPSVGVLNNIHHIDEIKAGTYFLRVTGARYWDYDSEYTGMYNFTVFDETAPYGDANLDGKLNTGDAAAILRSAAGMGEFTDEQKERADFNCDGKINTGDAAAILRHVAGLD